MAKEKVTVSSELLNDPWDKRDEESAKAYEAFCVYRDMGLDRSVRKVAQHLDKSRTLIGEWCSKYNWVERVTKWDLEQERIARQEQAAEIRKMRKRHADLATRMLEKAAKALDKIPEEEIKSADVSRMVETASKLERISRGDVETVVEERLGESVAPAVTFYMPNNGRDQDDQEDPE